MPMPRAPFGESLSDELVVRLTGRPSPVSPVPGAAMRDVLSEFGIFFFNERPIYPFK